MTPLEIDGCKVVFGGGSFAELDGYLSENAARISKTVILCDTNSHEYCLPLMAENLPALTDYEIIEVEPGEENKNLDTCRSLWEALSDMHADRRTLMINLGGGVVCDMGGFTASCYMRGIDFINVPTTLLSQVDASVGGKTGVDLGGLKNIVGLFSLPRMVVVNPLFIQSLPQKEVLSGFAEMIKHGLICDRRHWEELSSRADFSLQDTGRLVYDSVKIKYDVVLEDPTEKGLRKTLNFGHTIGHAVETFLMGSENPISHGHAVAIGMVCETWLSSKLKGLDGSFPAKFKEYVKGLYGNDVNISTEDIPHIISIMRHDKKNTARGINFTLLEDIGRSTIDNYVPEEEISEAVRFYGK